MSWKKRFTFRDKRGTECKVGGKDFIFYPNRLALLTEARDLSGPIAKAINTLFADESRDAGSSVKRTHEGEFFMEDIKTDPLSLDMAKHRVDQRSEAIETIMGTLADKKALNLLGRLFMDSLRDEFPYKLDRSYADVEYFLYGDPDDTEDDYNGLDMPTLVEMFQGWMKGNAKVFGAAGEKMVGMVREKVEGLRKSSELETTNPTNGEPSKIPTSQQSEQDSEPISLTD